MKHVVLLTGSPYPQRMANTIQTWHMARAFQALGWRSTVLTVSDEPPPDRQCLPADRERFTAGLEVTRLRVRPGPLQGVRFGLAAARAARAMAPTLGYSRSLYGALFCSFLGVPAIFEGHQELTRRRLRWVARTLARRRRCLGIVAISQGMAECFYAYGVPRERVLVAHDGVDPEWLSRDGGMGDGTALLPGGPGQEARPFTVGYVGHVHPGRGIDVLLEAGVQLPDAEFYVVGGLDGPVQRLRQTCEERGVANVRLVGHVAYDQVPLWLQSFDALVMPFSDSLETKRTASPMKLFEYMASGKPIIATDLPTIREVLDHEKTALLVAPDDPHQLAAAIRRLRSDPQLAASLGTEARRAVQSYTWERRVERIIRFAGLEGSEDGQP